jgi:hypothetical protein
MNTMIDEARSLLHRLVSVLDDDDGEEEEEEEEEEDALLLRKAVLIHGGTDVDLMSCHEYPTPEEARNAILTFLRQSGDDVVQLIRGVDRQGRNLLHCACTVYEDKSDEAAPDAEVVAGILEALDARSPSIATQVVNAVDDAGLTPLATLVYTLMSDGLEDAHFEQAQREILRTVEMLLPRTDDKTLRVLTEDDMSCVSDDRFLHAGRKTLLDGMFACGYPLVVGALMNAGVTYDDGLEAMLSSDMLRGIVNTQMITEVLDFAVQISVKDDIRHPVAKKLRADLCKSAMHTLLDLNLNEDDLANDLVEGVFPTLNFQDQSDRADEEMRQLLLKWCSDEKKKDRFMGYVLHVD